MINGQERFANGVLALLPEAKEDHLLDGETITNGKLVTEMWRDTLRTVVLDADKGQNDDDSNVSSFNRFVTNSKTLIIDLFRTS